MRSDLYHCHSFLISAISSSYVALLFALTRKFTIISPKSQNIFINMPPKGGNAKKESGRAKKAENEAKKADSAAADKVSDCFLLRAISAVDI
jgi:hypothetical protein